MSLAKAFGWFFEYFPFIMDTHLGSKYLQGPGIMHLIAVSYASGSVFGSGISSHIMSSMSYGVTSLLSAAEVRRICA